MSRGRTSQGFTLLEVMLAMAIVGFITTIMWGSFSQAARNKRAVEAAQDRSHTVRVALLRMAREIEMAYLSESENTVIAERRTLLVGTTHPDVDELMFSAFAHQRLRADVAESDTSIITYYGERDPEDRAVLNLMRRETRRLQAENPKSIAGESYILCPNVSRVKFNYYDHKRKEWLDQWDTMSSTGMNYLPTHIRITLTVLDDQGREVSFATDARIHVTERVGYRPVPQP